MTSHALTWFFKWQANRHVHDFVIFGIKDRLAKYFKFSSFLILLKFDMMNSKHFLSDNRIMVLRLFILPYQVLFSSFLIQLSHIIYFTVKENFISLSFHLRENFVCKTYILQHLYRPQQYIVTLKTILWAEWHIRKMIFLIFSAICHLKCLSISTLLSFIFYLVTWYLFTVMIQKLFL